MKKIIILILVVTLGLVLLYMSGTWKNQKLTSSDYKNAIYMIENRPIVLVNGKSEIALAPGSISKIVTQYFGNETTRDLNGDGLLDVASIFTQTTGGSGTFYYAVVALKTATGYRGTNGLFLGDRIAPQTTEIKGGELVVNYADRNPGEPFSTQPSLAISKYLKIKDGTLVEVLPMVQ